MFHDYDERNVKRHIVYYLKIFSCGKENSSKSSEKRDVVHAGNGVFTNKLNNSLV